MQIQMDLSSKQESGRQGKGALCVVHTNMFSVWTDCTTKTVLQLCLHINILEISETIDQYLTHLRFTMSFLKTSGHCSVVVWGVTRGLLTGAH